jgi:nucleoside triphosphatase
MKTITAKDNFGSYINLPGDKFVFRPSIYGVIINQGRVVLMKNKRNQKYWFPGGGLELGETIEEALKREIREETGLEVEVKELLLFKENFFYYQPLDEAYHAFLFFFACETAMTNLISDNKVDDYEAEKPRWVSIDEIKKQEIGDLQEDIFQMLQKIKYDQSIIKK